MAKGKSSEPSPVYRYQALIQDRLADLSTAEQAVAAHLVAHPEQLPFETADSLAKRLRVSAMTVGRTLKALGYQGLADLRTEMRLEVSEAPWNRRGDGSPTQPTLRSLDCNQALRAEIEAIEAVHALAETPIWHKAVQAVASADQVFVPGFVDRTRSCNIVFGPTGVCTPASAIHFGGGSRIRRFENRSDRAQLFRNGGLSSLFALVSTPWGDGFFPWHPAHHGHRYLLHLGGQAHALYAVRAHGLRAVLDNNAPLASLLNLLLEDVIEQLGDQVHAQLDAATEFRSRFVGFERVHRQPGTKK